MTGHTHVSGGVSQGLVSLQVTEPLSAVLLAGFHTKTDLFKVHVKDDGVTHFSVRKTHFFSAELLKNEAIPRPNSKI